MPLSSSSPLGAQLRAETPASITAFKVREKYTAGLRLLSSGHILAAIQQFQEASFFDAEDALPVVALAECYVFLSDLRSAIRCYRRALWSLHKRARSTVRGGGGAVDHGVTQAPPLVQPSPSGAATVVVDASHPEAQAAAPGVEDGPKAAERSPSSAYLSSAILNRRAEVDDEAAAGATTGDGTDTPLLAQQELSPAPGPLSDAAPPPIIVSTLPQPVVLESGEAGAVSAAAASATAPPELTAAEVRARLAGVLDALGLSLFQVGNVEQALRCTTEALELLAAGDGGSSAGQAGAVSFLSRRADPFLCEPTIALHRGVFLMALQREEEAESLLDRHYQRFEECRAQCAPLLIQLYCNRQAFRKARLLLESQEESGTLAAAEDAVAAEASTVASGSATDATARRASYSETVAGEGSKSAATASTTVAAAEPSRDFTAFPALPSAPSLTVAKYIFTELFARYRSAALASDDEDSVTRCLDVYPNDVDLLFRRAQLRIAAGDLKRSITDLFRCVQDTNGEHQPAIEAMTSVLFAIGSGLDGESEVQNAVTYYSESLKWRPDNVLVLLARGDCYTKMESFEEALADYQAILNYAPGHRQAQGRIATLHDLWGRKFFAADRADAAEAEFTNAIKADPTNPDFYHHRALCRLKLNQGQYALRDVLSCKELNPTAPHLRAFIARYMAPLQLPEPDEEDGAAAGKGGRRRSGGRRKHRSKTAGAAALTTSNAVRQAASKWYGARTPPPPPLPPPSSSSLWEEEAGGVDGVWGDHRGSGAARLSNTSAVGRLPPIPQRSVARVLTTDGGGVRGCHTTLHRRHGESPLAHTK